MSVFDVRGVFKKYGECCKEWVKELKVLLFFLKIVFCYFSKGQVVCWCEVVCIVLVGVLIGVDMLVVEVIVCLLFEFCEMKGMVLVFCIIWFMLEMVKIGFFLLVRVSFFVDDLDDDDEF